MNETEQWNHNAPNKPLGDTSSTREGYLTSEDPFNNEVRVDHVPFQCVDG